MAYLDNNGLSHLWSKIVNLFNKRIEVSETAPTEEENKIWLQPITTNAGAVDYIVDEGVSGIWTYRKWNSGIAECWNDTNVEYTVTFTNSSATPFNGLPGGTTLLTTTLPFTFITAMSWWTGNGRTVIPNRNYTITDSNICKISFAQSNNNASATSVQGAIRVVGKWK